MLSKIELVHLPPDLNVYVALYRDVQNAAFLREQLIKGNSDFEFAFIEAKSILSTTHLLAAVFRAVNDMNAKRMKSWNVHSEIVFCLNPNNNIAESFRKFGVNDHTRDLLVVKISKEGPQSFTKLLEETIQGQPSGISDENIRAISDEPLIRKTYKLPRPTGLDTSNVTARKDLELSVLGLMALRGAT